MFLRKDKVASLLCFLSYELYTKSYIIHTFLIFKEWVPSSKMIYFLNKTLICLCKLKFYLTLKPRLVTKLSCLEEALSKEKEKVLPKPMELLTFIR